MSMMRKKRALGDHSRKDLAEKHLVLGPYKIIDNNEGNNGDDDDDFGDGTTKGEGMLEY